MRRVALYVIAVAGLVGTAGYVIADGSGPENGHIQEIIHFRAPDGGLVRASATGTGVLNVQQNGNVESLANWTAPDGGIIRAKAEATGVLKVHESGYTGEAAGCTRVVCSTVGDGGVMTVGAGRYISTVTGSAVSVANGLPCVAFQSANVGRTLPENSVLDWTAVNGPDAGGPNGYSCCAQTAGSVWELCVQN